MRKLLVSGIIIVIVLAILINIRQIGTSRIDPATYPNLYCAALDSFMYLDQGLNGNMEYISIDIPSNLIGDDDRKELANYLKKYNVEIKMSSLKDLEKEGLYSMEKGGIDGVLLSITQIRKVAANKYVIDGTKYRGNLGAIGASATVVGEGKKWKIESSNIGWVS